MARASVFHHKSTANVNATVIKAKAGRVHAIYAHNLNAAVRYLKLYDKATTPAETDTPVVVLPIPGNAAGAGFVLDLSDIEIPFDNGIGMRLTTGLADNNTGAVAANEQVINLFYS